MPSISTRFRHLSWNESTTHELPNGCKLTRAEVKIAYSGEWEGESLVEYVMSYQPDGSSSFVGMERFSGQFAGRRGSFAIRHVGYYDTKQAHSDLTVVEGSGTDELVGLAGTGQFSAGHAESYPLELDYDFS